MKLLTKKDAEEQGLTRYFTGKPCPYGHIADRFVSTRACSVCVRERKHRWNKENPAQVAKQRREWVTRNPEKAKQSKSESQKRNREAANLRNRRYAVANREGLREKNAQWAADNPGKVLAKAARRRCAKLQRTPPWADFMKIERAYDLCAEYRAKGIDAEVDHIIPLQGEFVSGLHVQGNLQIIDIKHNRSKSNFFRSDI